MADVVAVVAGFHWSYGDDLEYCRGFSEEWRSDLGLKLFLSVRRGLVLANLAACHGRWKSGWPCSVLIG